MKKQSIQRVNERSSKSKITIFFIVLLSVIFIALMLLAKNYVFYNLINSTINELTGNSIVLSASQIETIVLKTQASVNDLFLFFFVFIVLIISFTWWYVNKTYISKISKISDSLSKLQYQKISKEENKMLSHKDEFAIVENKIEELVEEINLYYDEMQRVIEIDSLTGVLNRIGLKHRIEKLYKEGQFLQKGYSLLFLNINNFRAINDSYGNKIGDLILIEFSRRLKSELEKESLVARISGDEFVVFFNRNLSKEEVQIIEDQFLENISKPYNVNNCILKVNASMGLGIYSDGSESLEDVFISASLALKYGKRNNKSGIIVYEEYMKDRINEVDILKALEDREVFMVYQPQIESKTGDLKGVEALARWYSKKYGAIPPNEFIRIAEDTGAIQELGRFIMEEVFKQISDWKKSDIRLNKTSINLSPTQLLDKDLCHNALELFEIYNIDKEEIYFEITEEIPLSDQKQVIDNLACLNKNGIKIYVDDFGKGYSSLSYIFDLPISGLKIDKSFVDKIEENDSVVKTIFALAKSLNLEVVVEGVETEEQKAIITGISDCTIQGYYYSKPLKNEELIDKYFIKKTSEN